MPIRSELIDEMIARTSDWRGEALARLRDIIHIADPDIVEEVKWRRPANPMGSAVFEHSGIVCMVVILKERTRLVFACGTSLRDPQGLYNAQLEGNKSRAIDFPPEPRLSKAPSRRSCKRAWPSTGEGGRQQQVDRTFSRLLASRAR